MSEQTIGTAAKRVMSAETASRRARALRQISSHTLRPMLAALPVNAHTLPAARMVIDQVMRAVAPVLNGTAIEAVEDGPVRAEWVRGPRATRDDAAILYVHGGGFITGSARSYRGVTSRLSTATRLPVLTVDYRLAPENPYTAAASDVSAAYRVLREQGFAPDRIVIAGDSAGGYLATDFVIGSADRGRRCAAALLLFSPMADLALDLARRGGRRDALLDLATARAAVAHLADAPRQLRPRSGTPLPPTLIHASRDELFAADAIALADHWSAAGARCDLRLWARQMHVFHTLAALVPESRMAYRASGRFVIEALESPAAQAI
ncbi:alpha/beta hydrolase [Nocardia pseudovaccinii]|uniref:alpha/beta hydrolase n=1 Tax=Nocardia pseudovaccinii TaxID=189540 RepID=UPI0007A3EFD2|nr:alpha/beta hydrolase [Nocardia pseudovaccinii]